MILFISYSYVEQVKICVIHKEIIYHITGLPLSGKNIWKMKLSPGQGKIREFCGWSGKFRQALESRGKSGN